jgi:hypothetical protein
MPPAEFRPNTSSGERLLAHEVAHTIQQSKGSPTIQREEAKTPPGITAQGLLGLLAGSRIVIGGSKELIDFLFNKIEANAPEAAGSMNALFGKEGVLATATEDLVEIRLDKPASLPAVGKRSARTICHLSITLRRNAEGHFDFAIAGSEGD